MHQLFLWLMKIGMIIISADFISGFVHWWEDAFGNPNWKILGEAIVKPNIEHHQKPRKFLQNSFWDRVKLSLLVAIVISLVLFSFHLFRVEIGIILLYAAMANELHAIAHRTDKENGRLIVGLQKLGLIQSRKMHGHHHRSPYNVNYCILTNYLNPPLNLIRFWDRLEYSLALVGIHHNRNHPDRNGY